METKLKANLVICNPQNDFIEGEKCDVNTIDKLDKIITLINDNQFTDIIIPIKSYPVDSKVFKHNDTRYCINYTDGCAINKKLLDNITTYYTIVSGEINNYIENSSFAYSCYIDNKFILRSSTDYFACATDEFIICGFDDNMVIESIKSLLISLAPDKIKVFLDGTNNINNSIKTFCKDNNIEII